MLRGTSLGMRDLILWTVGTISAGASLAVYQHTTFRTVTEAERVESVIYREIDLKTISLEKRMDRMENRIVTEIRGLKRR